MTHSAYSAQWETCCQLLCCDPDVVGMLLMPSSILALGMPSPVICLRGCSCPIAACSSCCTQNMLPGSIPRCVMAHHEALQCARAVTKLRLLLMLKRQASSKKSSGSWCSFMITRRLVQPLRCMRGRSVKALPHCAVRQGFHATIVACTCNSGWQFYVLPERACGVLQESWCQ